MLTKVKDTSPPAGLRRVVYRAPLWFYRLGLGRFLGGRFLLLRHTGRKSGVERQAVLEVVRYDSDTDTYLIASGWGARAQWYQNLLAQPHVRITVGGRHATAEAVALDADAAEREMVSYAKRNPAAARFVAGLLGYRIDGTDEDIRALAALVPFVALRVVPGE